MNTEITQDTTATLTAGQRLCKAREDMGLSIQVVAERLCLKQSTIREIETDTLSPDLAATFVRGYIRSYAKLVHLPEEELFNLLANQAPVKASKVATMQSLSLGKKRKKRDGWLMIFTWLILFIVVGLTGAWWWQNYKEQRNEITVMANNNNVSLSDDVGDNRSIDLTQGITNSSSSSQQGSASSAPSVADNSGSTITQQPSVSNTEPVQTNNVGNNASNGSIQSMSPVVTPNTTVTNPLAATATTGVNTTTTDVATTTADTTTTSPAAASASALIMTFSDDCWLQVKDASGKELVSGLQKQGTTLNLDGKAPYRLVIGAPAAVSITYQGNPVDLTQYIRSKRVARMTVGSE